MATQWWRAKMYERAPGRMPRGFTCPCHTFNRFPPFVYSHWRETILVNCCNCGRKHSIQKGVATCSGSPR